MKNSATWNKNLSVWNQFNQVPAHFTKPIAGGKLKGKSDINPQWRLMAMTQAFGSVGHGWTYRIVRTWNEIAPDGSVMCFAEVAVKTKLDGEWGQEFSGIGGSNTVEKNKNGLVANDEGYKMAVTDALSVAFKAVGVAADIYLGNYDGSKYLYDYSQAYQEAPSPAPAQMNTISDKLFQYTKMTLQNGVTKDGKPFGMAELGDFIHKNNVYIPPEKMKELENAAKNR